MTIQGEIVKEVLKLYINHPSLALAKKVYADNPEVFTSVESARGLIRYYRAALGDKSRAALKDTSFAKEWNKYKLPLSEGEDYDPFYIDKAGRTLIFSDLHLPYHDVEAITVMFDYSKDKEFDNVLINGDFWDFHQLSYFLKDPRKRGVKYELDAGRAFFVKLREIFPTQKIYFKMGNHDERWENYLKSKAPELYSTDLFHLEDLFKFGEFGIEVISDRRIIKLGKLNVLHGHEIGMKGINVNPARTTFLKTYDSTLIGHSHRSSEHTEATIDGKVITCWSTGCLCWLHPHYAPLNKWSHGFATVRTDEDGNFNVKNRRIIEGEVR